ncbi:MAG: amidohydrolase family protein, partial [Rhizobiaceae bacterium]
MRQADIVLKSCKVATMLPAHEPYGLIENAAIALSEGAVAWVGAAQDLPAAYADWHTHDLGARLVTPALIDCHTHVVHGGNRANEFEMRLQGATYEEVARAGGGIVSTVNATRQSSEDELITAALPFVDAMIAEGICVIEIKSGYGLDQETELRMLRTARAIGRLRNILVRTSFLGAHAIPAEYKGRADAYINNVCIPTLRAAHAEGLVDAVDGFCEGIAFSPAQIERVFKVAAELNLPVKLHAEQLSNLGGAALGARYGALSCDHLEYLDEAGVEAMA